VEDRKVTFFRIIYGETEGYVCISKREPGTRTFEEYFFKYPLELGRMVEYCNQYSMTHDIYYCPQVFAEKRRQKEYVKTCPTVWADLDTCSPSEMLVQPSIAIQSSPGRYQALWVFKEPLDSLDAEDLSKRIAYYHAESGADRSGWDLTQLLRVPFTLNHKYRDLLSPGAPQVKILSTSKADYQLEDFVEYPQIEGQEFSDIQFPEKLPERDQVLEDHRGVLKPQVWVLLQETPATDWSRALWQLEMLLAEAGMTREEMYVVAREAACNKYERDGKSEKFLWRDVCKAYAKNLSNVDDLAQGPVVESLKDLLTEAEREYCQQNPTFIEEYVEWAKTLGDAAWQYHQAGAFVILSSLLAGTVRLPTSFGLVVPNLWFMILADTTLTRKTTAMDIAMDLIVEVDSDAVLATDGSLEGLMTSLSMRPGRPSVFLRDEFSGLLESMTRKDYYAGMAETLTKLYDGKFQKRVLRKEVLEVRDPVLIIFAGGIKTRIMDLLTPEQVASGFMPRFVIISAESDVARLKPLGPPTDRSLEGRAKIIGLLKKFHTHYNAEQLIKVEGKTVAVPRRWDATLTDAAWSRYNALESEMLNQGLNAMQSDLTTPTFDRLAKSGLKMAVLLAAAETLSGTVTVQEQHVVRAFYYIEQWRYHTAQVVQNIGKTGDERRIERVYQAIQRRPDITRSTLMQSYHLNAREAEHVLTTLEQRGVIIRIKQGRTERLNAIQGARNG